MVTDQQVRKYNEIEGDGEDASNRGGEVREE
jgi:hypothetical protein